MFRFCTGLRSTCGILVCDTDYRDVLAVHIIDLVWDLLQDNVKLVMWVLGFGAGAIVMHLYLSYRYFYGIRYQRQHESLNQTFERLD